MNEEEAKTKQCCGPYRQGDWVWCVGSLCMAWRWETEMCHSERGYAVGYRETEGYCGLAGKPERESARSNGAGDRLEGGY